MTSKTTEGKILQHPKISNPRPQRAIGMILVTLILGKRMARELDEIICYRGELGLIVTDDGTESTSNVMLASKKAANTACTQPAISPPLL
jgi:hypothetical protein